MPDVPISTLQANSTFKYKEALWVLVVVDTTKLIFLAYNPKTSEIKPFLPTDLATQIPPPVDVALGLALLAQFPPPAGAVAKATTEATAPKDGFEIKQ